MKNKIYKKIGLLSISALAALSLSTQVKAEQECKDVEYSNYYFFSGIYTEPQLDDFISNKKNSYNGTFFPSLPSNAKIKNQGRICLSNDENASATVCTKNDLNLNNFYSVYKKIMEANQVKTFSVKYTAKGGTEKTEDTKVLYLTEGKTTYYLHDKWYTTDEDQNVTSDTSTNIVRYQEIDTADLVNGAIIPSATTITLKDAGKEALMFNVGRFFNAGDKTDKAGFDLTDYYADGKTYLTPALYKITYTIEECGDTPEPTPEKKFEATIKYVDKDTGKEFTDKRWTLTDLEDGAKNTQKSPKIDGCTPDEEEVAWRIAGKNFEHTVYYVCEVDNTPKTGNVLIFVAWVVGLSALGYSVYWFKKNKTEEV